MLVTTFLLALSAAQATAPKWQPHVEIVAEPGNARSLGKLDFFAPFLQDEDTLVYLDFRGVLSSDPSKEGNFGAGVRHIFRDGPFGIDSILGIYGFFDASSSEFNNTFYQASGGVEWLTTNFEFRVNGYLPDNRQYTLWSQAASSVSLGLSGTTVQKTTTTSTTSQTEEGLPGFDAEAGMRLASFGKSGLWIYGGYFDFSRGDMDVSGPRVRVELPIDDPFGLRGSRLTIGAEFQEDAVRGTEGFGLVRLRIPFSPAPLAGKEKREEYAGALTGIDRRMISYVQRDNDIVAPSGKVQTSTNSSTGDDTDPATGQAINVYNVAQGASGDCSAASPCSLSTATAKAGTADILVLRDSGGTVTEAAPLVLGTRQQLIGGGSGGSATVMLASGDQLSLSGLGARPTLNNTSAGGGVATNPVVQVAQGGIVSGVALTGGDAGVRIASADGVKLSNVQVNGTNGAGNGVGVYATGSKNMTFDAVDINNISGSNPIGVRVEGGSSGVTITGGSVKNTTSTGAGAYGMVFTSTNNVSISGTTIDTLTSTSSSKFGIIYSGSSFSIANSTFANVPQYGLLFNSDVTTVSVGTTAFNTVGLPINLHGQNFTTLTGSGNTWTGSGSPCTASGSSGGPGISFTSPAQTCH